MTRKPISRRELAYEGLRHRIITCELAPRQRLIEEELAELLGVSRTPIREALQRLADEGLVVLDGRQSARVADLGVDELEELYAMRAALEGLAAAEAARSMSDEELDRLRALLNEYHHLTDGIGVVQLNLRFHAFLVSASQKPRLIRWCKQLQEMTLRYRLAARLFPDRMRAAVEGHRQIVDALATRDPALARSSTEKHIQDGGEMLLRDLRSQLGSQREFSGFLADRNMLGGIRVDG